MLKKKKKKKELWLQCCCIGILETLAHGEKEFTNGMRLQKKTKKQTIPTTFINHTTAITLVECLFQIKFS
jgi:hypothetical protein